MSTDRAIDRDRLPPLGGEQLIEALLDQERELGELLCRTRCLEQELAERLEPALAAQKAERAVLQRRLAEARSCHAAGQERQQLALRLAATETEYQRAVAEISCLRSSWSWRLTAPLRLLAGLLLGFGRGR